MDDDLINGSLRRLLDETSDLVESPTFSYVLTRLLDAAFSHLVDYRIATEAFEVTGPGAPGTEARIVEITDKKCKLAHILPVFCRQAHVIAAGSGELDTMAGVAAQEPLGNEYLSAIDQVGDLGAFAAVIYSSNFEYEVPAGMDTAAAAVAAGRQSSPRTYNMSTSSSSPDSVAQEVGESPPRDAADSMLEESEVLVLSHAEEDNPPAPAPQPPVAAQPEETPTTAGEFETAWQKATSTADEDEKPPDDEVVKLT